MNKGNVLAMLAILITVFGGFLAQASTIWTNKARLDLLEQGTQSELGPGWQIRKANEKLAIIKTRQDTDRQEIEAERGQIKNLDERVSLIEADRKYTNKILKDISETLKDMAKSARTTNNTMLVMEQRVKILEQKQLEIK